MHGGIGSGTQTLAQALVAHGHDATVFVLSDGMRTEFDGGVRVQHVVRRAPLDQVRTSQQHLRGLLQSGELSFVEAPECEAHLLPGGPGTAVRFQGGHHFWCATLSQKRRWRRLLLEQYAVRRAGALCAVSRFAANQTRRSMHLGKREIDILANPVDTQLFQPDAGQVVPGRVVFVGSLVPKKGIFELLAAFRTVSQQLPGAELVILGDGAAKDEVHAAAAGSANVSFLGAVGRAAVAREMARAQVCVFPSYMETQGIVLAEAMACGRPVIASARGPGTEVVGPDGQNGWLVDPRDRGAIAHAICTALGDLVRCNQMGELAREWAIERYSRFACLGANVAFWERNRYHG